MWAKNLEFGFTYTCVVFIKSIVKARIGNYNSTSCD